MTSVIHRTGRFINRLYSPRAGDGCVLWLPGQDDAYSATIRDRSGKGNNGTITGATWVWNGRVWYLNFDAIPDDYVSLGSNASLWNHSTGTFLFWTKTAVVTDYQPQMMIGQGASWGSQVRASVYVAAGTYRLKVLARRGAETPEAWGQGFNTGLASGGWILFGLMHDGINPSVYAQTAAGLYSAPVTAGVALTVWTNDAGIWHNGYLSNGPICFSGAIALPRIYNRALSATEIAGIYNQERHLFGV